MPRNRNSTGVSRVPIRGIGAVGTTSRICLGVILLVAAVVIGTDLIDVVIGLLGLPVAVIAVLTIRGPNAAGLRLFGTMGYAVNYGIAAILLAVATVPALLFYGASMLVAAVRGYAGCEIFAISNWITARDDAMACPVFSPIDAAETRFRSRPESSI